MSMISQIFGNGRVNGTPPEPQEASNPQAGSEARGREYLSGLSNGQTVEGKVTDIRGQDVQIELPNGGTVTARLENAMSLEPGQLLTFELRSNSSSQITLTPLYTNLTMDPTAMKALSAAGMTADARNMAMASAMMDAGMNIDSRSLGDMYHLAASHPDTNVETLVEMKRLGLPVNEETIGQFTAFKNYEMQISEGMKEIADGAVALYEEMAAAGGEGEGKAIHFMKELTGLILSEPTGEELPAEESAKGTSQAEAENAAAKGVLPEEGAPGQKAVTAEGLARELSELLENGAAVSETGEQAEGTAEAKAKEALRLIRESAEPEIQNKAGTAETASGDAAPAAKLMGKMAQILEGTSGAENLAAQIKQLPPDDGNALKLADAVLKHLDANRQEGIQQPLERALRELLHSEDFKDVVKNALKENWSLHPEQVADKQNVEALYRKLTQQTQELAQNLGRLAEPGSSLAQSLGNMSNDLDFMNQMNQSMQYIQLPLKMSGSEATGDLYVYSDKKSLAASDGNVSAMLHLDMKYLGTVDVYAAISGGDRVSTHFYLENDEVIDLISEHIHVLNERLEKRGYHMNSEITNRDALGKDGGKTRPLMPPAGGKLLSKQSFDVRA
ncbi:MAG: flagellar hook-length control protein FliK [Lachnospiraceae bacterium]|nr:flagellar hook-length control protein FliK [Lachnospiraceae bacterium]